VNDPASLVTACVDAEVVSTERLSGGASADLWSVRARTPDGVDHRWVLRRARGGAAGMSIGVEAEVATLRAAARHGVGVPRVLGATGDAYVMEELDGETLPGRLLHDERFAAARDSLLDEIATTLAAIHSVPVDELALPTLSAAAQVEQLEQLHRSIAEPVPAFELALRWLRAHEPSPARSTLVHGDFRTGNLLVDESGLRAVLDWELGHLGDPWEDLGWFCAPAWRFGGDTAGGFGSREELYAAYERAAGVPVDVERVRFWEILATLKWGVICQFQAHRHLSGQSRSIELATIGRRVSETEVDLLLLIDEEHP